MEIPVRAPASLADWQKAVAVACAAVACILALDSYATLASVIAWGHDEVHYYASFDFKLVEDGRWLNYLLHDWLRSIPLRAWALGWVVGWAVLLHGVGRDLGLDRAQSVLLAATALLALPFVQQSLWPATTAPALALLLVLQWLARRRVHRAVIYLAGGAAMFGSMQSFYFLLPLLLLSDLIEPAAPIGTRWRRCFTQLGYWIAGAFIGVVIMSLMLWILAGRFGVEPAAWRMAQPIGHAADVLRNLGHVVQSLVEHATILLRSTGLAGFWLGGGVLLLAALRARALPQSLPAITMLLAVALGFFAMSVPLAPVIQTRSLVALWTAAIVAVALLAGSSRATHAATAMVLAAVAWHLAIASGGYLRNYDRETSTLSAKLGDLLPDPIHSYRRIALFGTMPADAPHAPLYNDTPRMHGLLYALGARDYMDCRTGADPRCLEVTRPQALALPASPAHSGLTFATAPDGTAVIDWREAP